MVCLPNHHLRHGRKFVYLAQPPALDSAHFTQIGLINIQFMMTPISARGIHFCTSITMLVIGINVGSLITFLYHVGPIGCSLSFQSPGTDGGKKQMDSTQSVGPLQNGWSTIDVFYGNAAALDVPEGRTFFAQVGQDEIIMDLIGPGGYFLDLAANDAFDLSNTYGLEQNGWTGLCVEANPDYWFRLAHRKCKVVGALVGGTVEKVKVKFYHGKLGPLGGIVGFDLKNEPDAVDRYTAPFEDILLRNNVPSVIDYFSLDVEGAEYLVMKGFPFEKYRFKVMTVERPGPELQELFRSKGYVFLKELGWFRETLWAHESMGLTPDHPKIVKIKNITDPNTVGPA